MTIQATHYGTLALVIIGSALGIFILTAGHPGGPAGPEGGDRKRAAGRARGRGPRIRARARETGHGREALGPPSMRIRAADRPRAKPIGPAIDVKPIASLPVGPDAGHAPDHDAAEETDDYAWAPGRADPR